MMDGAGVPSDRKHDPKTLNNEEQKRDCVLAKLIKPALVLPFSTSSTVP